VNCIAPGDILIETNKHIGEQTRDLGISGKYFRKIPSGRRGTPEEIGTVAAFLASEEASYIHGETIVVDGGFLIY
jgi:3-oxoacyl-[acyl-carrier protein] reductase